MKESEIEKNLNLSYNSLSYSLDMTHKLLDLSRFEAGRIKLEYNHISLKEIVTNIEKEYLPQLLQKRIILDIENVEDEIITVDPSLFSKIVQNVINNAIKFTPIDGKIEVKSCIENGKVKLSIKDNGIGIPPSIIPYLFDISKKTSEIGTEGEKGHGIGLLFSNDLIRLHHGEIIPSNNVEGGACFTITIPHNEKTMLLTDDSDKYRNDLANTFRNENWLVIEESNGKELLETLERIIPDVIITDKNMPELDGIKAIEKINKNTDYDDILIFLLSADFSPESIELQENEFLYLERVSGFISRFESFEKIKEFVLKKYSQNLTNIP
jgi:CheY-like chemotaxis protein